MLDDRFCSSTCQHLHELILGDPWKLVEAGHHKPGPRFFEAQIVSWCRWLKLLPEVP